MKEIIDLIGSDNLKNLIILSIGFLIIWLLVNFIKKKLISNINSNENKYKAKKISNFFGYFFASILLIIIFNSKFTGLSVVIGVVGAGIAFALQELFVSFAGWIAIMFGGFYDTGDRIELGGITGDVMDIGLLRTTIMETGQWVSGDLYNGRIVLVSNSYVFKQPVFNYSGGFPFLWDEIKIPIQYGSDYRRMIEILNNIGKEIAGDLSTKSKEQWTHLQDKYRLEDAKTEPIVSLIANDNWVEFTLRFVVDYKKRRITKTDLFLKILDAVENSNNTIRMASTTIQLVDLPDLNVNFKNSK